MTSVVQLLVICLTFSVSESLRWAPNPRDGEILHACEGGDVTVPWVFNVTPGENITSVRWLLGASEETVAVYTRGLFLPGPAFGGRVRSTGATGSVTLHNLTKAEAVRLTVEVGSTKGEVQSLEKRSVVLRVHDGLPTKDDRLHVTQKPDALFDTESQKWVIVLACGHFKHDLRSAFAVEWVTPSGTVLPSSRYEHGSFYLYLASSVEGGSYLCRVVQQHLHSTCLKKGVGQASVEVNAVDARLMLLEAELGTLRQENHGLKQQVSTAENRLTQQVSSMELQFINMEQQCAGMEQRVTSVEQQLTSVQQQVSNADGRLTLQLSGLEDLVTTAEQQIASADNRLTSLETARQEDRTYLRDQIQGMASPRIAFNAYSTVDQFLSPPSHVKFHRVLYNQGGGFDSSTGDFTAPVSGVYVFYFHTQSYSSYHGSSTIKVKDRHVCWAYTVGGWDHGSCQAAVYMKAAEKAWVEPYLHRRGYNDLSTSFMGFLLSADP